MSDTSGPRMTWDGHLGMHPADPASVAEQGFSTYASTPATSMLTAGVRERQPAAPHEAEDEGQPWLSSNAEDFLAIGIAVGIVTIFGMGVVTVGRWFTGKLR